MIEQVASEGKGEAAGECLPTYCLARCLLQGAGDKEVRFEVWGGMKTCPPLIGQRHYSDRAKLKVGAGASQGFQRR